MKKTITTSYTEAEFRAIIREEIKAVLTGESNGQVAGEGGFLGVKEAADFLKLAPPTIYNHINKKTIPFHKKEGSRRVLFVKSELLKWLKEEKK